MNATDAALYYSADQAAELIFTSPEDLVIR